ncbi:MAG: amidohydrolase family protein [Acidobacteriota bacterium]|nr:amidohydrolase family protein [Acidobacteriota bacterium]
MGEGLFVLEGATLIDGSGAEPREDSVIVLAGDRILRVGNAGDFRFPNSARRRDVSGHYVVPGFIDMHVHVHPKAGIETVEALLDFGVTTIRSPGAAQSAGVELRDQIAAGRVRGPRMFTGAAFIDGSPSRFDWTVPVATPDEMRDVVRQQAAAGADMVKLYWDVTPELMAAAIEEAHALGLKVAGHIRATSWTQAARLGIDSLVHSGGEGPTWELVPERHRAQLRALPYPEYYARWLELVELDGELMNSLIAALVDNDVTVDPTLVVMESLYFGDDPKVLERLEPQRAPPSVVALWGPDWRHRNPFVFTNPMGILRAFTSGKDVFPVALQIVRMFHEGGVRLTVGTDVGMPWITPGVSLHRELELLVQAGIDETDVIVMATRNGAEGLGLEDQLGTVVAGKLADLVVLTADPLSDIRNTRSVSAVYKAGELVYPATPP